MLIGSFIDRLPVLKDGKVTQYVYENYIELVCFIETKRNFEKVYDYIESHMNDIKNDPDRWILGDNLEENQYYFQSINRFTEMVKVNNLYYPKIIPPIYLTQEESDSLFFDTDKGRWVSSDPEIFKRRILAEATYNNLFQKLGEPQSCRDFVRLIKTLPHFSLKLTEEQTELISTPGNVLAIGRSGTGKTTCSLLRMFASEIVFRFRMQKGKEKLNSGKIDKPTPLHCIFVTASPVLTNEVNRYYDKLNSLIKEELESKEKLARNEESFEELKLERQTSELSVAEEIEIESNSGPSSMSYVTDDDFPLFVTVRKLILMIDGSLHRPFFDRTKSGKVIGSSTNFEWHNELVGSLKISKNYKKQKKMHESTIEEDDDLINDFDTTHVENQRPEHIYTHSRNYEVDYKAFERFIVNYRLTFSSPLIIWTEISAYIKGHSNSYSSPNSCLSLEEYLSLGRKSSLLSLDEKREIYQLFLYYEG